MNPENLTPQEQMEARLTALLLGELPGAEAEALRAEIAHQPELQQTYNRLQQTIELVRETVTNPMEQTAAPPEPLKLSDAKREKLLAQFKTIAPKEFEKVGPRKVSWVLPIAAAAAVAVFVTFAMRPNYMRARTSSQSASILNNLRQIDGAKQQWAMEQKAPPTATPTWKDVQPYLGRGTAGSLPEPVSGEKYVLGSLSESPTAELNANTKKAQSWFDAFRLKEEVPELANKRVMDANGDVTTLTIQSQNTDFGDGAKDDAVIRRRMVNTNILVASAKEEPGISGTYLSSINGRESSRFVQQDSVTSLPAAVPVTPPVTTAPPAVGGGTIAFANFSSSQSAQKSGQPAVPTAAPPPAPPRGAPKANIVLPQAENTSMPQIALRGISSATSATSSDFGDGANDDGVFLYKPTKGDFDVKLAAGEGFGNHGADSFYTGQTRDDVGGLKYLNGARTEGELVGGGLMPKTIDHIVNASDSFDVRSPARRVDQLGTAANDPNWIGVLENGGTTHESQKQAQAGENQFISRYGFIALPAGENLDVNSIHNQASQKQAQAAPGQLINGLAMNRFDSDTDANRPRTGGESLGEMAADRAVAKLPALAGQPARSSGDASGRGGQQGQQPLITHRYSFNEPTTSMSTSGAAADAISGRDGAAQPGAGADKTDLASRPELVTRSFKVEPGTFEPGLKGVVGIPFNSGNIGNSSGAGNNFGGGGGGGVGGGGGGGAGGGGNFGGAVTVAGTSGGFGFGGGGGGGAGGGGGVRFVEGNESKKVNEVAKNFFVASGVDLDEKAGKSVQYNAATGELTVRGTATDLALVENATQTLRENPPDVKVKTQFAEVTPDPVLMGGRVESLSDSLGRKETDGLLANPAFANVIKNLGQRDGVEILTDMFGSNGRAAADSEVAKRMRERDAAPVTAPGVVMSPTLAANGAADRVYSLKNADPAQAQELLTDMFGSNGRAAADSEVAKRMRESKGELRGFYDDNINQLPTTTPGAAKTVDRSLTSTNGILNRDFVMIDGNPVPIAKPGEEVPYVTGTYFRAGTNLKEQAEVQKKAAANFDAYAFGNGELAYQPVAPTLQHRWSFDSDLTDSIGGAVAQNKQATSYFVSKDASESFPQQALAQAQKQDSAGLPIPSDAAAPAIAQRNKLPLITAAEAEFRKDERAGAGSGRSGATASASAVATPQVVMVPTLGDMPMVGSLLQKDREQTSDVVKYANAGEIPTGAGVYPGTFVPNIRREFDTLMTNSWVDVQNFTNHGTMTAAEGYQWSTPTVSGKVTTTRDYPNATTMGGAQINYDSNTHQLVVVTDDKYSGDINQIIKGLDRPKPMTAQNDVQNNSRVNQRSEGNGLTKLDANFGNLYTDGRAAVDKAFDELNRPAVTTSFAGPSNTVPGNPLGFFPGKAYPIDANGTIPSANTLIPPTIVDGSASVADSERRLRKPDQATTLVQDAKVLLEAGRADEAETRLREAVKADPSNVAANQYLKLLDEKRVASAEKRNDLISSHAGVMVENEWNVDQRVAKAPATGSVTQDLRGIEKRLSADLGADHPEAKKAQAIQSEIDSAIAMAKANGIDVTEATRPYWSAKYELDKLKGLRDVINSSRGKVVTGTLTPTPDYSPAQMAEMENQITRKETELAQLRTKLNVVDPRQLAKAAAAKKIEQEPPAVKTPVAAPVPQPEVLVRENAFSTFSLNVSDVSFKLSAASLEKGTMPDVAGIRAEEFINAFDYRDAEPPPGACVGFAYERVRYPFAHNRDLLRFSVKTASAGRQSGRPMNIVLLLDNSGSMERSDRVQIIRQALRVLASQLGPQDTVSVVTFARTARLWVDGVAGDKAGPVMEQAAGLTPEGGTNLEDAMNLAYATALRHYLANGANRVVLLTDGAANLGDVDPETLKAKVESHRKQGVALDCFGIGWEGYNDDLLEVLSRNGDGRYGFINTPEEAATGFAQQLAGALQVAASDVKVQVEFNPKRVTSYRQIGYAKHQLKKEQFRDNTVDAAELGAAESGNALYTVEVNPAGEGPVCTVRVRYKVPGTGEYREQAWTVPGDGNAVAMEQASPAMKLAGTASAFSEWLAQSPFAEEVTPDRLLACMSGVPEVYGADRRPEKLQWMIRQAKSISGK